MSRGLRGEGVEGLAFKNVVFANYEQGKLFAALV